MIGTIYLVGCVAVFVVYALLHFTGSIVLEGENEKVSPLDFTLFILKEILGSWISIIVILRTFLTYGREEE